MRKQFKKCKGKCYPQFPWEEKKKCKIDLQKGELFSASPQLSKNGQGQVSLLLLSNQFSSSRATQHIAICICNMDPSSHPKIQQVHTAVQREYEEVQELSGDLSLAVRGLQFSPERNLLCKLVAFPVYHLHLTSFELCMGTTQLTWLCRQWFIKAFLL